MILIFICVLPELSQLLVASFSCEPHLYFFTGRYSEPCCFRHHVTLGTLSLYHFCSQETNDGLWEQNIDIPFTFFLTSKLKLSHVLRRIFTNSSWLREEKRTLTNQQWKLVESAFNYCSLPLYTKLVFEDVLHWKSYTQVCDFLVVFPFQPISLKGHMILTNNDD